MKQIIIITVTAVAVVGLGVLLFTQDSKKPPIKEEDIISRNGIHWHPHMEVYVKGEKQEIASGIGSHSVPMHTHDSSGTLHMEMNGRVTKDDIKVTKFFEIWGRRPSDLGQAKMFVNDKENSEFENYVMQDNDHIVIRFE